MDLINWNALPPHIPVKYNVHHEGEDCIALAVRSYQKLPWFANASEVVAHFDVRSDGDNIVYFFHNPMPVSCKDEGALFKGIIRCLQFLQAKGLALEEVTEKTFCHAEGEFACLLSPACKVTADPRGQTIILNKQAVFREECFKSIRIRHALCRTRSIDRLQRHPATWSFAQDMSLLFHFIAVDKKQQRNLNHLIKKNKNGTTNWATIQAIKDEVDLAPIKHKTNYNSHDFMDLVRFVRNRCAHFYGSAKSFSKRFRYGKDVSGMELSDDQTTEIYVFVLLSSMLGLTLLEDFYDDFIVAKVFEWC
jgi:hypothetical protein